MLRPCDSCGQTYEAKTARSKFCTTNCRVRASRGARRPGTATVTPLPQAAPASPDSTPGWVAATREELRQAGRLETALGASALSLAARLEAGGGTDTGTAALNKEWRATLDGALQNAKTQHSPLEGLRDELAERRARLA